MKLTVEVPDELINQFLAHNSAVPAEERLDLTEVVRKGIEAVLA